MDWILLPSWKVFLLKWTPLWLKRLLHIKAPQIVWVNFVVTSRKFNGVFEERDDP